MSVSAPSPTAVNSAIMAAADHILAGFKQANTSDFLSSLDSPEDREITSLSSEEVGQQEFSEVHHEEEKPPRTDCLRKDTYRQHQFAGADPVKSFTPSFFSPSRRADLADAIGVSSACSEQEVASNTINKTLLGKRELPQGSILQESAPQKTRMTPNTVSEATKSGEDTALKTITGPTRTDALSVTAFQTTGEPTSQPQVPLLKSLQNQRRKPWNESELTTKPQGDNIRVSQSFLQISREHQKTPQVNNSTQEATAPINVLQQPQCQSKDALNTFLLSSPALGTGGENTFQGKAIQQPVLQQPEVKTYQSYAKPLPPLSPKPHPPTKLVQPDYQPILPHPFHVNQGQTKLVDCPPSVATVATAEPSTSFTRTENASVNSSKIPEATSVSSSSKDLAEGYRNQKMQPTDCLLFAASLLQEKSDEFSSNKASVPTMHTQAQNSTSSTVIHAQKQQQQQPVPMQPNADSIYLDTTGDQKNTVTVSSSRLPLPSLPYEAQDQPRELDVLCGRGGLINKHIGRFSLSLFNIQ